MNWVGGVRRRVLQREEVKRRQDLFFAAHAVSKPTAVHGAADEGQQGTTRSLNASSGPHANRNKISPRKWKRDDMVCEKIRRGQAWNSFSRYMQEQQRGESAANQDRDKRIPKRPPKPATMRPASIHGPFSRYLLQMELQSVGLKLEDREGQQSSFEKHRSVHSRAREQKREKEKSKRARDKSRNDNKNRSYGNEENNMRKPSSELHDAKSRKTSITTTNNDNDKPSGKISHTKNSRDHDKRNITSTSKGHHEEDGSGKTSKGNLHICTKTQERKSRTQTQTAENDPKKQVNTPKNRGRKGESDDGSIQAHKIRGSTENNTRDSNDSQSNISTRTRGKVKSSNNTNKRKHCNMVSSADDAHESQGNVSTASKQRKDKLTNSTRNKYHTNADTTKKSTLEASYSKDVNMTNSETSGKHDKELQEERSSKRACKTEMVDNKQRHSKRRGRDSDLLAGAPRIRQVLSLSPARHKGRIWAPLNLSSGSFKGKTKTKEVQSKNMGNLKMSKENGSRDEQKNKINKPVERSNLLCNASRNKHHKEWEDARLKMLLGPDSNCTLDSDNDKQTDAHDMFSKGVHECQLKPHSSEPSKNDTKQTPTNSHPHDHLPATEHMEPRMPQPTTSTVQERDCQTNRLPKLSAYTRKIYKVESGLSFARERKDKTPYLDRSFGTPWLGSALINTPGSSLSSSKTPTDPTLERSCEDAFGSQDTELHMNSFTPLQNTANAQNQEYRRNTNDEDTNIQDGNVSIHPHHLFNGQCASEDLRSVPSAMQSSKQVHGRWVESNNDNELVSHSLQFLACPFSDKNEQQGLTLPEPFCFQWPETHTNHNTSSFYY